MYCELPGRSGDGIASTNASCQEERVSWPRSRTSLLWDSGSAGEIQAFSLPSPAQRSSLSLDPLLLRTAAAGESRPREVNGDPSVDLGGVKDLAAGSPLFWRGKILGGGEFSLMAMAFAVAQGSDLTPWKEGPPD